MKETKEIEMNPSLVFVQVHCSVHRRGRDNRVEILLEEISFIEVKKKKG